MAGPKGKKKRKERRNVQLSIIKEKWARTNTKGKERRRIERKGRGIHAIGTVTKPNFLCFVTLDKDLSHLLE